MKDGGGSERGKEGGGSGEPCWKKKMMATKRLSDPDQQV